MRNVHSCYLDERRPTKTEAEISTKNGQKQMRKGAREKLGMLIRGKMLPVHEQTLRHSLNCFIVRRV